MCGTQKNWPKRKPRSKAGPQVMSQMQREEEEEDEAQGEAKPAFWAVCTPSALPTVLQQKPRNCPAWGSRVWCCLCFTSRRSWLHQAKLLHPPLRQSFWQNESGMCGLSPQRGWDLAKVASEKGRVTCSCEWGVWFWEKPYHIFNS